jgi:hypothetical protein
MPVPKTPVVADPGRIWEEFKAKYGSVLNEHELRGLHRKWSALGKLPQTGEKYR